MRPLAGQDMRFNSARIATAEGEPGTVLNCHSWGYCYKVLLGQGPDASGGRRTYFNNGIMTDGFAMIAYPFDYNVTGCESLMISHTGTIFKKDLGPSTHEIVRRMTEFNPDSTWIPQ
jgi:hypothetical protein